MEEIFITIGDGVRVERETSAGVLLQSWNENMGLHLQDQNKRRRPVVSLPATLAGLACGLEGVSTGVGMKTKFLSLRMFKDQGTFKMRNVLYCKPINVRSW